MHIIIVCHGSRSEENNLHFKKIVDQVSELLPDYTITASYLDFYQPFFDQTLVSVLEKSKEVIVVPLFFFNAKHTKEDIPNIIANKRKDFPKAKIQTLDISQAYHQVMQKEINEKCKNLKNPSLVFIARGSSDESAVLLFHHFVKQLEFEFDYDQKVACYCSIAKPSLKEELTKLSFKSQNIVVYPYILFKGKLYEEMIKDIKIFCEDNPDIQVNLCNPFGYLEGFSNEIAESLKSHVQ
jgi:sirohydrochlorin ferrochelatase